MQIERSSARPPEAFRPAPADLAAAVNAIEVSLRQPLPAGYLSEWCAGLPAFIASLGAALETGLILLIDYGLRYDLSTFTLGQDARVDSIIPNGGADRDLDNLSPRSHRTLY